MPRLKSKDIVAFTALLVTGTLKLNGYNGEIDSILALIVGYYFARRNEPDHSVK